MTTPPWISAGTFTSGVGGITPPWGAGATANDIGLLVVETNNETVATPSGWAAVANSPQETSASPGTRCSIFWKRHTGSETDPTITDPGNHIGALIHVVRGCITSGDPWNITTGGFDNTSSTALTVPGGTTTVADCLVLVAATVPTDLAGARFSAGANGDLGSFTERSNDGFLDGDGGGLAVWTGTKATAGAYGNTTATTTPASKNAFMTIALKPAAGGPAPLSADAGAYAVTGSAATLRVARKLAAVSGVYALTGAAATLTATGGPAAFTLAANTGSYAVTGSAATLPKPARKILAASGVYAIQGSSATLIGPGPESSYYATRDLASLAVPYEGRLLSDPVVRRKLVDTQWGMVEVQDVSLELANLDGALTAAYVADPSRLRGRTLTLTRYDDASGYTEIEWTGRITSTSLTRTRLVLRGSNFNRAAIERPMPEPTVETADFPNAVDVGATIPVPIGAFSQLPLLYVNDDLVGSLFDYLVGHGAVTLTALERNVPGSEVNRLVSIAFSECVRAAGGAATSWAEAARTDLYPGFTAVRFLLRQGIDANVSGGLHTIYATGAGLTPERNPVRLVRTLLAGGLAWSLGETVNATSFDTAEAQVPAALRLDGVMRETRQAQDWLREILMMRGMRLGLNAAGEWTISVDTPRNRIRLQASDARHTLFDATREAVTDENICRRRVVKYRKDFIADRMTSRIKRTVNGAAGRNRVVSHHLLSDHTAADLVAGYLADLDTDAEETFTVDLPQEARELTEGDLIELTDPLLGSTDAVVKVVAVDKGLTRIRATAYPHWWGTYFYTPGTLPPDAGTGSATDLSRTLPTTPTTPAISASGTRVANDGHVTAWVTLSSTVGTSNVAGIRWRWRTNGTTPWIVGTTTTGTGAQTATIEGLLPGQSTDYSVEAVNAFGLVAASAALSAQVTPTDASVPSTPDAPIVFTSKPGTFVVVDGSARPLDFLQMVVYWNSVNTSATANEIARVGGNYFVDTAQSYNAQRWYFTRHEDQSHNLSPFSASGTSGASGARQTQGTGGAGDVATGSTGVGTTNVVTDAITGRAKTVNTGSTNKTPGATADISGRTATLTVSSSSNIVAVTFQGNAMLSNDHTAAQIVEVIYTLTRADNSVLLTGSIRLDVPPSGTCGAPMVVHYSEDGVSGSQTYKLRWNVTGSVNNSCGATLSNTDTLTVIEYKR